MEMDRKRRLTGLTSGQAPGTFMSDLPEELFDKMGLFHVDKINCITSIVRDLARMASVNK
jgi:hypothetical protein